MKLPIHNKCRFVVCIVRVRSIARCVYDTLPRAFSLSLGSYRKRRGWNLLFLIIILQIHSRTMGEHRLKWVKRCLRTRHEQHLKGIYAIYHKLFRTQSIFLLFIAILLMQQTIDKCGTCKYQYHLIPRPANTAFLF